MSTGVVLPVPNVPYDPSRPDIVQLWSNYFLSLRFSATNVAPSNAKYLVATVNLSLTDEVNLGALATGFVFSTSAAGVSTPTTTLSGAAFTSLPAESLTGVLPAIDASALTNVTGANVAGGGTYTPTLTGVANVTASTAFTCQYARVGAMVFVSGKVDIDPTLAATVTQLGISLPVASNFATAEQCGGTAAAGAVASYSAAIMADAANNRAELSFVTAVDVANRSWAFSFAYLVV